MLIAAQLTIAKTWNHTYLPNVQAVFRKGRGTRDRIVNICWIIEKTSEFKKLNKQTKKTTSASLTMLKPLTVWITTNRGIALKRWECQTTLPVSWETCMQVKNQQLQLDMEQRTGSKLAKEYIMDAYGHHTYLYEEYIMRNAGLDEAQVGIKISRRNINNLK